MMIDIIHEDNYRNKTNRLSSIDKERYEKQ